MLSESEASERAYVDYRRDLSLRYGILAVAAVGGTTLLTWPTDLLIFGDRPEVLRGFVMWRGGLIAVLVSLLVTLRLVRRPLPWVDWLSGVVFVLIAVVFGASLAKLGGIESTWFVAAYFVPFSTFLLVVPLRTRIAIVVSTLGALLGTYFTCEPAHAQHQELWSVIISLVSTAGFAILIGVVWERRTWRLFEQQRRLAGHNRELERQVGERARALQRLARHVTSAREEERTRIARELHDGSGALLTAMRLQVADARRRIDSGDGARDNLDRLDDLIDQSFQANGRLVEALRPAVLDELGLITTLERLCGTVESGSGVTIIRDLDPGADRYPDVATTVFRLVQEALTNVTRHAGASRTELRVRVEDGSLLVEVEDDGVGFDRDAVAHDRFGLLGMRERVAGLDGRLEIHSRPGGGTRIFATLPLPAESPA